MTPRELVREARADDERERDLWTRHAVQAGAFSGAPPEAVYPALFGPSGRWPIPGAAPSVAPLTKENVEARFRAAIERSKQNPARA